MPSCLNAEDTVAKNDERTGTRSFSTLSEHHNRQFTKHFILCCYQAHTHTPVDVQQGEFGVQYLSFSSRQPTLVPELK